MVISEMSEAERIDFYFREVVEPAANGWMSISTCGQPFERATPAILVEWMEKQAAAWRDIAASRHNIEPHAAAIAAFLDTLAAETFGACVMTNR